MAVRKSGASGKGKVEKVMHEHKEGKLKSGSGKKVVTSRKQAIAIALSARRGNRERKLPRKKSAVSCIGSNGRSDNLANHFPAIRKSASCRAIIETPLGIP